MAAAKSDKAADAESAAPTIELDEAWIESLVAASAALDDHGDLSAVVAVTIGKKQKAILSIVDGRVVGPGEEDAVAVTVPTTGAQLATFVDGSESVARAYMQGDLKPVGAIGDFLALVELFEAPAFREHLSS
ncbi:MAG: hypothetical protein ACRBK7_07700 [Acidimicrobiales bacterium]